MSVQTEAGSSEGKKDQEGTKVTGQALQGPLAHIILNPSAIAAADWMNLSAQRPWLGISKFPVIVGILGPGAQFSPVKYLRTWSFRKEGSAT